MITLRVFGTPAPQGSKRHIGNGRMIESSKKVTPWRDAIVAQAVFDGSAGARLDGPLELTVTFYLYRPKSHRGSRGLYSNAPLFPTVFPDLDKLARSTCDALTQAQVVVDDARFVRLFAQKVYADERATGALILVKKIIDTEETQ
jgi:Holliday junction resolvase RusA-like endonuclease